MLYYIYYIICLYNIYNNIIQYNFIQNWYKYCVLAHKLISSMHGAIKFNDRLIYTAGLGIINVLFMTL